MTKAEEKYKELIKTSLKKQYSNIEIKTISILNKKKDQRVNASIKCCLNKEEYILSGYLHLRHNCSMIVMKIKLIE